MIPWEDILQWTIVEEGVKRVVRWAEYSVGGGLVLL